MNVTPLRRRVIELAPAQLPCFYPLLQKGVRVPADVGCPLKSLLCDQFSIPDTYVTDRITTIFLDNHPVDDLDHAMIRDNSRIALSAAMPGLVGATMRRGGFYASLREGISQLALNDSVAQHTGIVTVKLFNLLLAELGPTLLAHGLLLDQNDLNELQLSLSVDTAELLTGNTPFILSVSFTEEPAT
jgi:hypothetical protein